MAVNLRSKIVSQKNETLPLILAFLITAGILGAGFWWFARKGGLDLGGNNNSAPSAPPNSPSVSSSPSTTFPPPTSVAAGTTIRIEGSTSMVQINQALKNRFEQQFSGTVVRAQARGTNKGIEAIAAGNADIAAISRPLTPQEQAQGLAAVTVSQDAIALVVGRDNPFRTGLTRQQVAEIFTGKIADWAVVGGQPEPIRVLNRPPESGTRQAFQEIVLQGKAFGSAANIITWPKDETTAVLRELKANGIGYATFAQVATQQTVRTVPIEGLTPEAASYPYQRLLSYAYQEPASPQVQAFLGFVSSPQGQEAIGK